MIDIPALRQQLAADNAALRSTLEQIANRTAQRAPTDKEFCARGKRAFDWAMDPKVTALAQVPPPYDLGPEMNIHACPAQ